MGRTDFQNLNWLQFTAIPLLHLWAELFLQWLISCNLHLNQFYPYEPYDI